MSRDVTVPAIKGRRRAPQVGHVPSGAQQTTVKREVPSIGRHAAREYDERGLPRRRAT